MCLIRNNKILSASYNYHLFKLVTKLDFLLVGEKNTCRNSSPPWHWNVSLC